MRTNISQSLRKLGRALLLEPEPYREMMESPNPFVEGLFLIIVIGLVVAGAGLAGSVVTWASMPDLGAIKQVMYENLVQMPWYLQLAEEVGSEFVSEFQRFYDQGWSIFPTIFGVPNPLRSLIGLILTPLILILSWLLYGVVAHLAARLLDGQATLMETLGATTLAVAPQLFLLATFLPSVSVAGLVGTWTLLCRYRALKEAHDLPWKGAVTATVAPLILYYLLIFILAVIGFAVVVPAWAGRI